jgi:GNAT superfamily N-acetyltransferase
VTVREARIDDLDAVVALLAQLHEPPTAVADGQIWRSMLDQPRRTVLIAEHEGVIVGTADVASAPTLTHGGSSSVFISNVVVDQTHRRTGIGRALFDHIEGRARERGSYKIELLSANERSDAHLFYEALGFERSAEGFRKYL